MAGAVENVADDLLIETNRIEEQSTYNPAKSFDTKEFSDEKFDVNDFVANSLSRLAYRVQPISDDLKEAQEQLGSHLSVSLDVNSHEHAPFDVPAKVSSVQALEELQHQLEEYWVTLHNQLVDLLNKDYADFISLSSGLIGTDEAVDGILEPAAVLKQQTTDVYTQFQKCLATLLFKLESKQINNENRRRLELVEEVVESVKTVRYILLGEKGGSASRERARERDEKEEKHTTDQETVMEANKRTENETDADDELFDDYLTLLETIDLRDISEKRRVDAAQEIEDHGHSVNEMERLSRMFARVEVLVREVGDFAVVRQQMEQIDVLKLKFEQKLSEQLIFSINEKNSKNFEQCLRAFTFFGKCSLAEEIVEKTVIAPLVSKFITARSLRDAQKPGGSLRPMFDNLEEAISDKCAVLLKPSTSSPFQFNFLANSIWKDIQQALVNQGQLLFAPRFPEIFHSNYTESMRFLSHLEQYCNPSKIIEFRQHQLSVEFRQKWNTAVYYQLRYQEIAFSLEKSLSSTFQLPSASSDELSTETDYLLQPPQTFWKCLNMCWDEKIWISRLNHDFFKLTLRLLKRFLYWLKEGCESQGGSVRSVVWKDLPVQAFLFIRSDLCVLAERVEYPLLDLMTSRINSNQKSPQSQPSPRSDEKSEQDSSCSIVRSLIGKEAENLRQFAPRCLEFVCQTLSTQCSAALNGVERVRHQYWMTKASPPTKTSSYVSKILQPLKDALREVTDNHISPDDRQILLNRILKNVTQNYEKKIDVLLKFVVKTENTLKRLNRTKRQSASDAFSSGSTTLSDADKIRIQLFMDVKEYSREVTDFALDYETLQVVDKLSDYVNNAESLLENSRIKIK